MRKLRGAGGDVSSRCALCALAGVALLAGCSSKTNMLAPKGPGAQHIASLWWWMLGGCSFGLLFITSLLILAWFRRRSMGPGREPGERAGWIVVLTLGVGVMVAGMVTLFIVSDVFVIRGTEAPAASSTKLTVRAVGHLWYWEFTYPGTPAVTADELHIPARTPVLVQVRSGDVIHSFWVPVLNRKIDAIPGQRNAIELYANEPGVYRGLCNQYCGLQHAHMGFLVFADPPAKFRAWLAHESQPAKAAASRGKTVFMDGPCSSCHTIRGTSARAEVGPDLTHVASLTTLAGVTIPNTRSNLARWITRSQSIKPGNQMPDIELSTADLHALVDYLETLK